MLVDHKRILSSSTSQLDRLDESDGNAVSNHPLVLLEHHDIRSNSSSDTRIPLVPSSVSLDHPDMPVEAMDIDGAKSSTPQDATTHEFVLPQGPVQVIIGSCVSESSSDEIIPVPSSTERECIPRISTLESFNIESADESRLSTDSTAASPEKTPKNSRVQVLQRQSTDEDLDFPSFTETPVTIRHRKSKRSSDMGLFRRMSRLSTPIFTCFPVLICVAAGFRIL